MDRIMGRTMFDFVFDLTSDYGLWVLLIVLMIFFGGWVFVHKHAPVGDKIVVWGLFRYRKSAQRFPAHYWRSLAITLFVFGLLVVLVQFSKWLPKPPPIPFQDDILAYYPFDNSLQNALGDQYHGVSYGGRFDEDRFGKSERAYCLNEHNQYDYIELTETSALHLVAGFTLAAWVKYDNNHFPIRL